MTWPNVLVLKYLEQSGQTNPQIETKARLNIALGYQRMLTFQHPDTGGFSWYGEDPEHIVLTAYGLMELTDMAEVAEVDETVLAKAANFLVANQAADGHWEPPRDRPFGTGGTVGQDTFQATTFITWSLVHSGREPNAVQEAVTYLMAHQEDATTTFAKALLAMLLSEYSGADQSVLADLLQELVAAGQAQPDGSLAWTTEGGGSLYDYGQTANLETTALVALALAKNGGYADEVERALSYLVAQKDALGNFSSTQATVFSLKALLSASDAEVDGTVTILLDGHQVAQVRITPETTNLFRVVDLKNVLAGDDSLVELLFSGAGRPSFQVVGLWYVPWSQVPGPEPGPLSIQVDYDKTELQVNDSITVAVLVTNNTDSFLPMVIVDLGTPPGFEPSRDDLDSLVSMGRIASYEVTDRQVIVYTNGLQARGSLSFSYRIRATMAFSGESPGYRAYMYYTPEVQAVQAPIAVSVSQ